MQAEDRVLRLGQRRPVQIEYLIAYETSDPYVYGVLENKLGE